jgi:YebC/PmpR family DNA-binding regulatory protein
MGRAFEFRKERKMKRWSVMAKTFARLNKDLIFAIKEGGGITDPDLNSRLRAVIQNCRAANMPKDNIERAIKKANDKDAADLKVVTFEGYAPHGVAVFVETATDNNNRTVANVRSHFSKCGGNMGNSGSVEFLFTHMCWFKISAEGHDVEELEFELIDFGVEDVGQDGDSIMMYGPFEAYGNIQSKLEGDGIEIIESGFDRIPTTTTELGAEHTLEVEVLIEKLENDDDVQNVFHALSSSSEDFEGA